MIKIDGKQYLDIMEVSQLLDRHPGTIRRWFTKGMLEGFKLDGTLHFEREAAIKVLFPVGVPDELKEDTLITYTEEPNSLLEDL